MYVCTQALKRVLAATLVQAKNVCLALLTSVANVDPGPCIRPGSFYGPDFRA
jgi:hypothetical protein